jgi:hypothetical protein
MEKINLCKELKLATDALAFYADPSVYTVRLSNPLKTSVVTIDGGLLARMTLDDLTNHLYSDALLNLHFYHLQAGEDD